MNASEEKPYLKILRRGLLVVSLILTIQRPANAADCIHYNALIAAGELEKAGNQLKGDAPNKACAFDLAKAYLEKAQREKAVDWINFARLFANLERDGELFYDIFFLKLLLAPDSKLAFHGVREPVDYEAEADYRRLEKESPERFAKLKNEAEKPYKEIVRPFEADPWSHPCPHTSRFWDKQFNTNTNNLDKICELVSNYKKNRGRTESRTTIAQIASSLESLHNLGVDISKHRESNLEKAEYHENVQRADAENISAAEKARILKKALDQLDAAQLIDWDPKNVRPRYKKASLMADMDRLNTAYLPGRETIESWSRAAADLNGNFSPGPMYTSAIELWGLWSKCQYSDGGCLTHLCPSNPCLDFIEDDRIETNEYLGKAHLSEKRQEAELSLENLVRKIVAEIESFFGVEDPPSGNIVNAENMPQTLFLLGEEYRDYVDDTKIQDLMLRADVDIIIAQAPHTFTDEASEWLKELRNYKTEEDVVSIYGNAISILKSYDHCTQSIGKAIDHNDNCLKLIDQWQTSTGIRRREYLMKYREDAERLLRDKTTKVMDELIEELGKKRPRIGKINKQVELLRSRFEPYILEGKQSDYEEARSAHLEIERIDSLVAAVNTAAGDPAEQRGQEVPEERKTQVAGATDEPLPPNSSGADADADLLEGQDDRESAQGVEASQGAESAQAVETRTDGINENQDKNDDYEAASVYSEMTRSLEALNAALSDEVIFFRVALSAWRGEQAASESEASKLLVSAINNLKSTDYNDNVDRREQIELFSAFQKEARKHYSSEKDGAHIGFVTNYFLAQRYFQKGDTKKMLERIRAINVMRLIPQEARHAIKKLEEAAALVQWAHPR